MKRVANRDMRACVQALELFENTNKTVFSTRRVVRDADGGCTLPAQWMYQVYSYGSHYLMYVYAPSVGWWFGNKDEYSRTTSRHRTLCMPTYDRTGTHWMTTREIARLINAGSYAEFCAKRMANPS